MNKSIRKLVPSRLLRWYRYFSKLKKKSPDKIFTEIYNNNQWKSSESISGTGSEIKQTATIVDSLNRLLKELKIKTLLDLPCGDFNWMRRVELSEIEYIGADIVKKLIKNNIKQYSNGGNVSFKVLNLLNDPLPKCDMIIVRDCLVHLSYKDINAAIKNIKSSDAKYLLTTTFTSYIKNHDIETGDWRPLNLQEKPFSFNSPLYIINENCTEEDGKYSDKSLALWEISSIFLT